MTPRRATRESGPATVAASDDIADDVPTRDELLEALANLRVESDKVFAEWQRTTAIGFKQAAEKSWKRWASLHGHMDEMCKGVDMHDVVNG